MEDEDGLTIVLTPPQLAAVLSGGTLDGRSSNWTRAWGGLKLVFGGLEELGAAGLLLAPEPTMVTKVAGAGLGIHGADTLQSGGRQLWTGQETRTVTSEASAALARSLGVNENTAREIGDGVDLAVPIVLTLGVGAVRLAAVRGGRIVLAEHEAAVLKGVGGHTILEHVGKTDAYLAARLAKTGYKAISTFNTVAEAEEAVTSVMRANKSAIINWAKTAPANARQPFTFPAARGGIGRVFLKGATSPVVGKTIKVILKKEAYIGKLYYVLTAFPEA